MAYVNKYFAAFMHVAPSDLEYYLEEMASNGYILTPLLQSGLFCFRFVEEKGERVKYVVDVTGLQKHMYMKMLIDKGWEYLGQVMNCHVWKMTYEGTDRPADFADHRCIRSHCIKMGIVFSVIAFLMLFLFCGYIFLIYKEHAAAVLQKHDLLYGILAGIQIPFTVIFAIIASKLFKEAGKRKQSIERSAAFKRSKKVAEEREEYNEEAGDNHED